MRNIALAVALLAGALVGHGVPARADCPGCTVETQPRQEVVPQVCSDCDHERGRIADGGIGGGGHSDDRTAASTRQSVAPGEERAVEGCAVIPEDLHQGAR